MDALGMGANHCCAALKMANPLKVLPQQPTGGQAPSTELERKMRQHQFRLYDLPGPADDGSLVGMPKAAELHESAGPRPQDAGAEPRPGWEEEEEEEETGFLGFDEGSVRPGAGAFSPPGGMQARQPARPASPLRG